MDETNLIWKDRKRIMGMPITFTKYSLSDDRIFLQTGLISTNFEELILYRVRDISIKITLWQRIFGVGTIIVHSADKTTPHLELQNIKQPKVVKEMIHNQVEDMKIARKMRVGEILEEDADSCVGEEL